MQKIGLLGSGSWGTALAKLLTANDNQINWWIRSDENIRFFRNKHHNPQYLTSVVFDMGLINFSPDPAMVIRQSEVVVIAVPSAFLISTFDKLPRNIFNGKKIISAVKGILSDNNLLVNEYLHSAFGVNPEDYFTILGPCHAEEVAKEKLSYLTFSGTDTQTTTTLSAYFATPYLRTLQNQDVTGSQYAAILKNIYAIGAGIAHGLGYGDNFQSVLIANSADEMAGFLRKAGRLVEVGNEKQSHKTPKIKEEVVTNYAASVYLGDLLVTCYSLYSRNRTFGNMIGKGYAVKTAQLEMNMVAEGYHASRCIHEINKDAGVEMPILETIYHILWEGQSPSAGFKKIEAVLI